MAANSRPYYVKFKGVEHMVEAPNPGAAARHVVSDDIQELKPATAKELLDWTRKGGTVQVAGQKSPVAVEGEHKVEATFTVDQAFEWLKANRSEDTLAWSEALEAWGVIVGKEEMALDTFDTLRKAVPLFGDMIVITVLGLTNEPVTEKALGEIRDQMQQTPFPLIVVIGAIEEQVRYENGEGE